MLEKSLVDSLYPGGWDASPDQDLDNFNQATADNVKLITDEMFKLAFIRCPDKTEVLPDLEREYGIVPNDNLSDEERRMILGIEKYKQESDGSIDTITTDALHRAGFTNITAYENDPAVDPDSIIGTKNFMTCGSDNSFCGYQPLVGEEEAICGIKTTKGYVLANGTLFLITPDIDSVCGNMYCGNQENDSCGHFLETKQDEIIYPITDDPNRWARFIFVGGTVVRGGSGEIISISTIEVSEDDRNRLEREILKFKPIETWAIMSIEYI